MYPHTEQRLFFEKTFGCVRFVYKKCLLIESILTRNTRKNG
nr:helix-turn-helix domain-containing protein [Virgibacillus proomii]